VSKYDFHARAKRIARVRASKKSSQHGAYFDREGALASLSCKKAHESGSCWLRIDKVFVYFTRLNLRDF
jgi:hypothetical protein